eukprot:jgi/Tetstr1/453537/TSEL_040505.t1
MGGLTRQAERRLLLLLSGACLALLCVIVIHMHQDVAYWELLEKTVQMEREARQKWQDHAEAVRAESAKAVSIANQLASKKVEQAQGDAVEAPPPTHATHTSHGGITLAGSAQLQLPPSKTKATDFKIYVYDLPKEYHIALKKDQPRCITDQYGTEIYIHETILNSSYRTLDPEEAEFFYVPIYGECYLFRANRLLGKAGLENTNKWFHKAMKMVINDHPYWNRTQGRDHVFVFAGARGPHIFKDWKKVIKKSIFMTPEGDRSLSEQFNTWKDIVIPGLEPEKKLWNGELRAKNMKRSIFASFRGTIKNAGGKSYSKGLRILMEQNMKHDKDIVFTTPSPKCDKRCYYEDMRKSVFCLCPRGWSPWTLRAYQGMMVGCIPVIIADEIEFPYENTMDWTQLTVKIAEKDVNRTTEILRALPEEEIKRKQDAIAQVWKTVTYPNPSQPGDAFHMIMQELGRKKRAFKASSYTFWN